MSVPGSPNGLTGTVLRGVGFAGSGFVLARGITLASYIVLARLITPTELGQFAAGSILVGIGMLISQSGMPAAIIQRRDRLEEAAATAVIATLVAGIVTSLLALASAPLVGRFFDSATVTGVAAAVAGVLLLRAARVVPDALLQRRFSFLRRLVVEPAAALGFGAGAIIATSYGLGVWGLVVGMYASAVIDLLLSWVLARWRPSFRLASLGMWRELVGYARHVLAGTLILRIGERLPTAVIGGFIGAAPLGQFQYANRIVATPYAFLLAGVSYVLFPAFARISEDQSRLEPAFLRSLRWMALASMPIGFLVIALGEPIAVLVFGTTWAEAGQAAMALGLFIPARAVASVVGETFKGIGVPREFTMNNLIGLAIGAAAMFALLPFGLIGVSAGVSVGALATAGAALVRAERTLGIAISSMVTRIWPPLLAAVVMLGVVLPIELLIIDAAGREVALGLLLVAVEALLGLLVYVAMLRVIAPGLTGELVGLLRIARQRRQSSAQLDPTPIEVGPEK